MPVAGLWELLKYNRIPKAKELLCRRLFLSSQVA